MLVIRNLIKRYKSKNGSIINAVNDISFKTESSGMVFLMGKSSSGKTTLLNIIFSIWIGKYL